MSSHWQQQQTGSSFVVHSSCFLSVLRGVPPEIAPVHRGPGYDHQRSWIKRPYGDLACGRFPDQTHVAPDIDTHPLAAPAFDGAETAGANVVEIGIKFPYQRRPVRIIPQYIADI